MKNKRVIILLSLLVVIITSGFIIFKVLMKSEEKYITDSDNLYDVAIEYLVKHTNYDSKNKSNFKIFTDYHKFGITMDKDYKYAYMYINIQSYYVKNNKIIPFSGNSMPYKFTFDKKTNKVIKYEEPIDGFERSASIKRMFPDDIEDEVLKFKLDDKEVIKKVKEYYSFLEDTNIYYK